MIRALPALAGVLILGLLLLWPVLQGAADLLHAGSGWKVWLSTAGLLLLLCAVLGWTGGWKTLLLVVFPLVGVLVILRLVWYGLVQFSGAGFTDEFFIHLEWQSVVLAWQEYGRLMRRALIALLLLALVLWLVARGARRLPAGVLAGLAVAGLVALLPVRHAMPEYELLQAWRDWVYPPRIAVDPAELARWRETRLVDTELTRVRDLEADAPDAPRNLILLYLESVGVALTEHPDWPGLMPNLRALLDRHALVESVQTSSYITIEGLTNSQCGTLFPFAQGSDSMAGGDGLAEHLACLGDVLSEAGYYQVYMGGASLGFAGKGEFLRAHGYDELWGMAEWREQGLEQRPGTWGLSDADLFEQSVSRMQTLQDEAQPWHMTLLTIGTHIPGYRYAECQPYAPDADVFIDALHCTDQLLGAWLQRLRETGLLDNALVVITADHHVFPSPDMRRLFGDAVLDRRLPLVVLGEDVARPPARVGAGYDLAPTLLDLLSVRHNARFALGRSLFSDAPRQPYFIKRYADIHDGERISNAPAGCRRLNTADMAVPDFPLAPCEKARLMSVLDAMAHAYSTSVPVLACGDSPPLRLEIPPDGDQPFRFVIARSDQAARFTYRGRAVDPARPGAYLAVLAADGRLLGRRALPAGEDRVEEEITGLTGHQEARYAVMLARPRPGAPSVQLPLDGLRPGGLPQGGGAGSDTAALWLIDLEDETVVAEAHGDDDQVLEFTLDPAQCQALLAAPR